MKSALLLTTVAVATLGLTSLPSFAQSDITGATAINDEVDRIAYDVNLQMSRSQDAARFGAPEFQPGFSGSASLAYGGSTGNDETQDLTIGLRVRNASGAFVQTMSAVLDYETQGDKDTKRDLFAVYDGSYYFNNSLYGFVLGRVNSDGTATKKTETQTDAFLGFGPGYRIVNTPQMTLRVQAGVGLSYLENGKSESDSEIGYIVSSRFFYELSPNAFVTNDTDVLSSDAGLGINNDLGVNFKVTEALSTRVSYLTEYDDSRPIRSDNSLGVAVVFGF
ncbi:MAG: DUF481 domain-containing protein [Candidatus Saccharibacteria bacterium]|nr:DUF481 domain-containing protein [Pseudorhodobacter sp.]